jgi:hypothetical protein
MQVISCDLARDYPKPCTDQSVTDPNKSLAPKNDVNPVVLTSEHKVEILK